MKTASILVLLAMVLYISAANAQPIVSPEAGNSALISMTPKTVKLQGYPGARIDECITERIKKQDVEHLVEPFRHKNETWAWQSEFWGKWMLSAVAAWEYTGDRELLYKIENAVNDLIKTQLPDGYIGNYGPVHQLTAWDIWGRKYTMLGLLEFHRISGDEAALNAAVKVASHLLSQVGPGKSSIVKTGFYRGMASCSVLEPIVYIYRYTNDRKFLDFAEYIVSQWETEDGPRLISKALNHVPVSERFPAPEKWWSWENGQKAYEMMSCYDGLLQLYLVTGKEEYLEAVKAAVQSIMKTEINVAGSGSAFECWYNGGVNQTRPTYHTMETCVTTTWMKLCNNLLQVTGDPLYADQVEKSFYNALLASMKSDASEIAKYSPLEGTRHEGEEQCGMHINCCNANGPRGFAMMPRFAFSKSAATVYVNFYCDSEADIELENGSGLWLRQQTSYPKSGKVIILLVPDERTEIELALRIPAWSERTSIKLNGHEAAKAIPGTWCRIKRTWNRGDHIELNFDMRARLVEQDNHQAILYGPVLLARDSRFNDGFVDETAIISHKGGYVNLEPSGTQSHDMWLTFTAPLILGTDLEGHGREPRPVNFCDFASAGNTWNSATRYRVWIPKTLNVMKKEYEGY